MTHDQFPFMEGRPANYGRTVSVEWVHPRELYPIPRSPKSFPATDRERLQATFRVVTNPILVTEDGDIVAGHARWEAAKELALTYRPSLVMHG